LLIACWLSYKLLPFVPALDWQLWKDSLRPLLLRPHLTWIGVSHSAAGWLAVATLWAAAPIGRFTVRLLPLLVLATLGLEVVIVSNSVTAENVLGAALGLAIGLLPRLQDRRVLVSMAMLVVSIVANGLEPFGMRLESAPFRWTPFAGFLGGSMFINTQVLFEKVFFYGALMWIAREAGFRLRTAVVGTTILTSAIELAQTRVGTHSPEITDPLLVVLLGCFIAASDRLPPRLDHSD
jgi:hypothetical protein